MFRMASAEVLSPGGFRPWAQRLQALESAASLGGTDTVSFISNRNVFPKMFHGVWIGPFIQRPTVLAALDPPISSLYSGAGGHWSGSMTASGRKAGQTGHEACSMGPKKRRDAGGGGAGRGMHVAGSSSGLSRGLQRGSWGSD